LTTPFSSFLKISGYSPEEGGSTISFSEYKSIVHRIFVELSKYNIDMEDNTIGHPKTNVDRGQYFFCLRLTKNPWGSNRRPM
jgi:hypothetical protein